MGSQHNRKMLLDSTLLKELIDEIKEEGTEGAHQLIKSEVKEESIPIKTEESKDFISKEAFSAVKTENAEFSSKTYTRNSTCCNTCGFKASSQETLKVHIEMKHLNLRYVCVFCGYNTKEKYTVIKHTRKEHPDKDFLDCEYKCDPCQLQEPLKVFKEHFQLFHPDLKVFYNDWRASFSKANNASEKKERNCTFCPFKANIFSVFNSHIIDMHSDILYHCKICEKECRSNVTFRLHMKQKHISKIDRKIHAVKG